MTQLVSTGQDLIATRNDKRITIHAKLALSVRGKVAPEETGMNDYQANQVAGSQRVPGSWLNRFACRLQADQTL